MDAFSLALIFGTQGISKKDKLIFSLIVGVYHFIMPLIGLTIGIIIIKKILFDPQIIVGIILCAISIEMIISSIKRKKEISLLTISGYLLFGLSVSIDSLTTGIGLSAITNKYFLSSIIFAIISSLFTNLGLNIGNVINIKYGNISTAAGGIIMFIIGLFYIIK